METLCEQLMRVFIEFSKVAQLLVSTLKGGSIQGIRVLFNRTLVDDYVLFKICVVF